MTRGAEPGQSGGRLSLEILDVLDVTPPNPPETALIWMVRLALRQALVDMLTDMDGDCCTDR